MVVPCLAKCRIYPDFGYFEPKERAGIHVETLPTCLRRADARYETYFTFLRRGIDFGRPVALSATRLDLLSSKHVSNRRSGSHLAF
jgi:hypothetical protein